MADLLLEVLFLDILKTSIQFDAINPHAFYHQVAIGSSRTSCKKARHLRCRCMQLSYNALTDVNCIQCKLDITGNCIIT